MQDLFNTHLPDGVKAEIHLCIFPHLNEFLVLDLRDQQTHISLIDAREVFTSEFFRGVEEEFSEALRAETDFPFAHLMSLPLRVEEAIKETALNFILDKLERWRAGFV